MCDLFLLYLDAISIRKANHELENEDPLQDVTLLRGFNEFSKQDLDFISEFYHHCNGDQLKYILILQYFNFSAFQTIGSCFLSWDMWS